MDAAFVRLYLVRHGEVDANLELRYLGRRDDPLNAAGCAQAARLAAAFAELAVDGILSSPLRRTLDTARAIADVSGLAVTPDNRLVELDFGDWEGLTRQQVLDRGPAARAELEIWEADPGNPVPGGESLRDVQRRVVALAGELFANRPGAAVTLVTHMGPIKALLAATLGLDFAAARRMVLDPATVTVIDWSAWPVLRLFNSHAHLGWSSARWLAQRSSMVPSR
jgi:probable phosphoglycerate mutase